MSLAEMIAKAVEREYTKKQKERYEKLRNDMITSTEISGICERKFIFSRRNPEIKPDRTGISTLMHGTMLHEYFEDLLQKYYPNMHVMESEYSAPLGKDYSLGKNYKVVGHIDVLSIYDPKNRTLYDFKTSNPYAFLKIRNEGEPKLQHKYQLNIYKHLLENNGIKVNDMQVVYINKSRMSFNRKEGRQSVDELEMVEVPVKSEPKLTKVLLQHGYDMLAELNMGYKGRNLEESLEKLKAYYKIYGLNPEELDKENFQKWMCDYCRYKDICMQKDKEEVKEGNQMNRIMSNQVQGAHVEKSNGKKEIEMEM